MSTSAVMQRLKSLKGFEKREEPEQISFKAGDIVMGRLESVEKQSIKDKETGVPKLVAKYVLECGHLEWDDAGNVIGFKREAGGKWVQFFGTHILNQRVHVDDVGRFLVIECLGDDTGVRRGENAMKLFEVYTWPRAMRWGRIATATAADGSPLITDDDIPF